MDEQGKLHSTEVCTTGQRNKEFTRSTSSLDFDFVHDIYLLSLIQQLIDRESTEGDRPREYPGAVFAVLRIPETYFCYLMTPTSDQKHHLMIRYVLSSL